MSDVDVADETSRHDFDESTTAGTEMEMSGQELAANKAMSCHLALPSLPVANLDLRKVLFGLAAILWKRYSKWRGVAKTIDSSCLDISALSVAILLPWNQG